MFRLARKSLKIRITRSPETFLCHSFAKSSFSTGTARRSIKTKKLSGQQRTIRELSYTGDNPSPSIPRQAGDSTTSASELHPDLDLETVEVTTQSIRRILSSFQEAPLRTEYTLDSPTTSITSRTNEFDIYFSAILYKFLDEALQQVRKGGIIAMDTDLAFICANIASSPTDSTRFMQFALSTIPPLVTDIFGRRSWSLDSSSLKDQSSLIHLRSATGMYAYHLTNVAPQNESDFYVGHTTYNFASRWSNHTARRKKTKRPKTFSKSFYPRVKLTKPRDINTFVLADISKVESEELAHGTFAVIMEAAFCVFFNTCQKTRLPHGEASVKFAQECRPRDLPTVPWRGPNFAFPLVQGVRLKAWTTEENEILQRVAYELGYFKPARSVRERDLNPIRAALASSRFHRSNMAILD